MRACFFAAGAIACWSTVAIAFKWGLADTTPAGLLLVATLTATLTLGLWTLGHWVIDQRSSGRQVNGRWFAGRWFAGRQVAGRQVAGRQVAGAHRAGTAPIQAAEKHQPTKAPGGALPSGHNKIPESPMAPGGALAPEWPNAPSLDNPSACSNAPESPMAPGGAQSAKRSKTWGRAALLGFINPFLYYLILFKAYSLLPAQVAQALNVIWPVLLVLLSIPILGQRIGWISLLGMGISFVGALVIATQGNLNVLWSGHLPNPLGVVLAASSSILWALYFLLNMKSDLPPVQGLFLNFLFASVYIILYILITHLLGTPSPLGLEATTPPLLAPPATDLLTPSATSLLAPPATSLLTPPLAGMTLKALLSGIYVGLFEMAIPFILWLNALHYARNTSVVSSLIYIFPFLSLILIHFVLGEPLFATTLIGLVFIVIGVLLVKR